MTLEDGTDTMPRKVGTLHAITRFVTERRSLARQLVIEKKRKYQMALSEALAFEEVMDLSYEI